MRRGWKKQLLLLGLRGNPDSPPKAREHPCSGMGQVPPGAGAVCKKNLSYPSAPDPEQSHLAQHFIRECPWILLCPPTLRCITSPSILTTHGAAAGPCQDTLQPDVPSCSPAVRTSVRSSTPSANLAVPLDGRSKRICVSDKMRIL